MRFVRFLLGMVVAAAVQVLGLEVSDGFLLVIDLFLVLAIFTSLDHGPVASMLAGSAAGLAQDALTGGYFGMHGFADTFVAWAAARIRQRFVIQRPVQVGMLFTLAAGLQQTLLAGLQFLMLPGAELPGLGVMAMRMASTGILGAVLFVTTGRFLGRFESWREKRRKRLALELD